MAFYVVFISITPAGEQRPEEIPSWHGLYVKPLSSRRRAVAKLEERRLVCSTGVIIFANYLILNSIPYRLPL